MTSNKDNTPRQFGSLAEIETYKAEVRNQIRESEKDISSLWGDLFQKESPTLVKTPTQRLMSMVNMGSGILDGLILGWKLYRKFKKPAKHPRTRRR